MAFHAHWHDRFIS